MTSVQSLNTDKNTWRTVTCCKKRKQSSHRDEGPARKRIRTNSVEVVSAPSFCDPKGSSDQVQDQHMEVEDPVPIYERHAEGNCFFFWFFSPYNKNLIIIINH